MNRKTVLIALALITAGTAATAQIAIPRVIGLQWVNPDGVALPGVFWTEMKLGPEAAAPIVIARCKILPDGKGFCEGMRKN